MVPVGAVGGGGGPISLGIDERSFRGKDLVITITCLNTHQMVAILPSDRQAELQAALRRLPEGLRQRIVAVCIDLKSSFRSVVEQELPLAAVVADSFYRSHTRAEAEDLLANTLLVMEASDDAAVLLWARTLRSWRREILAYFTHPITNGYTEGCYTKIKRLSYGFRCVRVYIRKMLLGFLPRSPEILAPHLLT
jgi:transposase